MVIAPIGLQGINSAFFLEFIRRFDEFFRVAVVHGVGDSSSSRVSANNLHRPLDNQFSNIG